MKRTFFIAQQKKICLGTVQRKEWLAINIYPKFTQSFFFRKLVFVADIILACEENAILSVDDIYL